METVTVTARSDGNPYRVELDDGIHQWTADEPEAVGGGDTAPNPKQLLCSSLAACTAITVRMYAARKEWPLRGVGVRITMNPEGTSKDDGTVLQRTLTFDGDLDESQRERLLQIANACPVHKILTGKITVPTAQG